MSPSTGNLQAFHTMAKPTGARCNLDCTYCFFLKKERLYPGSAFRSEGQRAFGAAKSDTLPGLCRECRWLFTCNGECPKNRVLTTPEGEPGLNWLCEGLQAFFAHTDRPMRIMADLLRRGLTADGVMAVLAEEERQLAAAFMRAGRNDLCPCGSGQKYKKCHAG